ncbi:ABC transporter substrate-binding protein [candidate division WOR-3 bacterium]|nr:ABC transporter substrate-binding protein [candidate division WOR-3 bacterium]
MKICMRFLISIVVLFLFNCKGDVEKRTVVTFWHAMGGPLGKTLDSLIVEFNQSHPEIKIDHVGMGNYQALSQKLMATVAAKKPPTISQVFESWTDQLYKTGALAVVEDLLTEREKEEIRKGIYPVFILDNTWEGKLLTFPFNKSVPAFFYNKTLFEEEGIEHFPENWDEYIEIGKKLTKDIDGDGITDFWATAFPMSTWMFETLLYQNGGKILDDDNITPLFNKKAGIESLTFLLDILNKYKIGRLTTGYQHQDDFLAGKVAIISGSVVSYSFIKDLKPDFKLGIAPIPSGKSNAVIISGTNIALFANTSEEQKKAALEFIIWFLSPEIQARWAYGTGYVPVRIKSLQEPLMKKRMEELPELKDVIAQLEFAYTEPRIAGWLRGRQILGTEGIEPVLRGVKSPEEALNDCAKRIEEYLRSE